MVAINQVPIVKTEMLIRRQVDVVFEAFINPDVTTKFWFTKSSGRLISGHEVKWDWEMYGVSTNVKVIDIQENKRILIRWGENSDRTSVEWIFAPRENNETLVTIVNSGFKGEDDHIVEQAIDSMGGFTMVLCGAKALLEHGIILNLISDKAPDFHVTDESK
jgi:uncharacterized protein YndB with AHSA1/START domain